MSAVILNTEAIARPFQHLDIGDLFMRPNGDRETCGNVVFVKMTATEFRRVGCGKDRAAPRIGVGLAVIPLQISGDTFVTEYVTRRHPGRLTVPFVDVHRMPIGDMPQWVQWALNPTPRKAVTKMQRSSWRTWLMNRLFKGKS